MWKWAVPLVRVLRNLLEKSVILKERPRRRPTRHWGADFESCGDCPKGEGAKENLGGISYLSVRYESRSEGLCGCETQRTAMEDEITARQKQNTSASARPHAVTEKKQKTFTEKKADHPGWTPKAETTGVVFIDVAT